MKPTPCSRRPRAFAVFLLLALGLLGLSDKLPALAASPSIAVHLTPIQPAPSDRIGFTSLPAASLGITFTNRLDEERSLTNQIFLNGSGVAAGDVDGDGLCDVFLAGLDSGNRLYRNLGGWHFADATDSAGVACPGQASTGAAFADLDGDGDLDLLVNGIAQGTRLFLNDGRGRFTEATDAWGLRSKAGATSLALADVNGDGWLDVYAVHYRNDTMRDMPGIAFTVGVTNGSRRIFTVNGQPATHPDLAGRYTLDATGGILENGEADALYLHSGKSGFLRQPWPGPAFLDAREQPAQPPYDWGLSAMFRDLNGDGAPDLYVCNDFQSPDRIWINDGKGRFHPIPRLAIRQTSLFSMGVDVADLNRDGFDDIFVADMLSLDHRQRQVQVMDAQAYSQIRQTTGDRPQSSRNTLFLNRGDATYSEIAQLAGVDASDWSWCPVFLDVDLDGYEDLLITTGHWRDAQHADVARELDAENERRRLPPREQLRQRRRFPRLDTPNVAFRNRGDLTFSESGAAWGFDSRRISQGIALADLDNDGDLDAVVNCLNDAPLMLRNDTDRARIAIRLREPGPNTRGIGARIQVTAPGLPVQSQEMICGGRYLSSDEPVRSFAAGSASARLTIEVRWRDGTVSTLTNQPANHLYEIQRQESSPQPAATTRTSPSKSGHFEDLSHLLGHQHADAAFDALAIQPLLPHQLSAAGPGVAWFDFNSDGWEDLVIGAGQGGRMAVFRNNTQGGFIPQRARLLESPAEHDQLGIAAWRESATNLVLLLANDGYAAPPSGCPPLRRVSLVTGATDDATLPGPGSAGPVALADIDSDGDLDLFVGGRALPGRYPEAAPSHLLRNIAGQFTPDPGATEALKDAGLVNGATFTDLDADGRPELVLATEWGPIRILRSSPNGWNFWDAPLRWDQETPSSDRPARPDHIAVLTGWWTSVSAGDFDGDGRMDLIAGNWGRNTARQRFLGNPLHLRFGTAEAGSALPVFESHTDPRLEQEVPLRDRNTMAAVFPGIPGRFPTFTAFAAATFPQILEAAGSPAREVTAACLDSMLLLNRGDHFSARALPLVAQIAPVLGTAVADFDGDGHVDAFLAQNVFGVHPAESRLDSGTGVWLRGGDSGTLVPAETGIHLDGEGRAVAAADFDRDGRMDLVVTQNRGMTRLLRNLGARPGLTVRLTGPALNPQAIGASVRLEFADGHLGPAHEIHLGSGYLSQDSPSPILGVPSPPVAAHIRWPGGRQERTPIQPDTKELQRTDSSGPSRP